VETNHRNVDTGPVENPITVAHGKEDVPCSLYPFEQFAICPASYTLRCQQTCPLALTHFDLLTALFKPVTTQVRLVRNTVVPNMENSVNVFITQVRPKQLSSQKRRIANDELRFRPFRLLRVVGVGQVEDCIHAVDVLDG